MSEWFDHEHDVTPHKAKKDRKRWCRGKIGTEHKRVVSLPPNIAGWKRAGCQPAPEWARDLRWGNWWCQHIILCSVCGKHLSNLPAKDCPDFTEYLAGQ